MRLLIILALFIAPTAAVQFYSADSYAITEKAAQQDTLFKKPVSAEKDMSAKKAGTTIDFIENGHNSARHENIASIQRNIRPTSKKRVKLIKGKRSHKGMQFLSVFLMLKQQKK